MKETKLDILKSYFALNRNTYWMKKFSDYELKLSRMSLTELASELNRTQVRHEAEHSIIVEHMLAVRLVRIQTRASWRSGWLSFAGAMLAVLLSFYLGQLSVASKNNPQIIPTTRDKTEVRAIEKPIPSVIPTIKQRVSDG